MKKQLLNAEYKRFASQVIYFLFIGLIVVGLTYPAIELVNSIMNDDSCMLDLTLGDICLIDSIIIMALAIIGLAVYGTLLKSALAGIIIFANKIYNIRQSPHDTRTAGPKSIVSCPHWRHQSRIPANKKIVFTCTSCKRRFEANNGVIVPS